MTGAISNYLKTNRTPIIEGNRVTFVWRGRKAPGLVGDINGWEAEHPVVMEKSEPGTWIYQQDFEADAYIEYSFMTQEESFLDPFNPRKTSNGIGGYNNYFSMPGYSPSLLNKKTRAIPHGTISTYHLPTDFFLPGRHRTVRLYHPPVSEPVPLIVVWDGQDYLHRVHLDYIVDNLINQDRIRPVAIAFVDNAGQDLRTVEYACSDATLAFLKSEVLPLADKTLNLVDLDENAGAYGVLGASMGGLMALYTGLRMPNVFGKVISQSGAFSLGDIDMAVFDLINVDNNLPITTYLDVGRYDLAGLLECNRRMRDALTKRGYPLFYNEFHAGHNYPAWRDDLWNGLESLFGIQ